MKSLLLFVLMSASLMIAQTKSVDSSFVSSIQDSICISDLVQQQIKIAREKQSIQTTAIINVAAKAEINQPINKEFIGFFSSLPLHIKIFLSLSIAILFTVLFRRTLLVLKKKSAQALKNKITMLREEKVVVKTNSKLEEARKQLRNSKSIFETSEKHMSKTAKELNISKGELLLASRLKLFEIGKI
jgi:hypothetical protein